MLIDDLWKFSDDKAKIVSVDIFFFNKIEAKFFIFSKPFVYP